jgi:hypothetical protein
VQMIIDNFDRIQPSMFEEESYHFLSFYQGYKKWFVYDSNDVGIEQATALIDFFAQFHGKIPFPNTVLEKDSYWSTTPLGVFKYKMLEDGSYTLVNHYKKISGYLVQGSYWQNGFFYFVKDQAQIIQLKLFVDENTFYEKQYPDIIPK